MAPSLFRSASARALAIAAPIVFAALPAAAELSNADSVAIYFRLESCTVAADRVGGVLFANEIEQAEYDAIVADMVARGFATGDPTTPGAVTLTPDFCGPATEGADPRRSLVQMLRFHGCALSRADTPNLLVPSGFTPDSAGPIIGAMIAAGEATPDGDVLRLSEEVCANGVE